MKRVAIWCVSVLASSMLICGLIGGLSVAPAIADDSHYGVEGANVDDPFGDTRSPAPDVVGALTATTLTQSLSADGVASGVARDDLAQPVTGASVLLTGSCPGEDTVSSETTTDDQGHFEVGLELVPCDWVVVATSGMTEAQASLSTNSQLDVAVTSPGVVSETGTTVKVTVTDRGRGARAKVTLEIKEPTDEKYRELGTVSSARSGVAEFQVKPWRNPQYRVTAVRRQSRVAVTTLERTLPLFQPVSPPAGAPEPRVREPLVRPPTGQDANVVIAKVSRDQWSSMTGLSWHRGCLARSRLRMVDVNYRGLDGYRHRGRLIVASSIARKTANIFASLYRVRYPIRQVRPVDEFGRAGKGLPGANDRRSMAADNTSAFNCRFVVGRESQRVLSPHATGRAIDINTWTNPYVSPQGVFPNAFYLNRRRNHEGVIKYAGAALRIFQASRCRWGGSFRDYQHFEC